MRLSELQFDPSIYPRAHEDSVKVLQYIVAMQAGAQFPPIVIDRATQRIVDGVHRYRAFKKASLSGDPNPDVEVEERDYSSEADIFRDAVALNAEHGLAFTPADRVRILMDSKRYGIKFEDICDVLKLLPEKAEKMLHDKTGTVRRVRDGKPVVEEVVLKGSYKKLRGQNLSAKVAEANCKSSGMRADYFVGQLTRLLEADFLQWCGKDQRIKLEIFAELLAEKLAEPVSPVVVRARKKRGRGMKAGK